MKKKKSSRGREDSSHLVEKKSESHQKASFQISHMTERGAWSALFVLTVVHTSHSVRLLMISVLEHQFP